MINRIPDDDQYQVPDEMIRAVGRKAGEQLDEMLAESMFAPLKRDGRVFAAAPEVKVVDAENPKDVAGTNRLDMSLVEPVAIAEECLAMMEGLCKYGRANYLAGKIVGMIYIAACFRHIWKWIAGEERDQKTGVHHLGSARACLGIVLAAQQYGTLVDNRPPHRKGFSDLLDSFESRVAHLKSLHKDKNPTHYTQSHLDRLDVDAKAQ